MTATVTISLAAAHIIRSFECWKEPHERAAWDELRAAIDKARAGEQEKADEGSR